MVKRIAETNGVSICFYSLDTCRNLKHDLLRSDLFGQLGAWCHSGKVFGVIAGFPYNTVSRVRHRPGGPPPLRSRKYIYGIPSLAGKHNEANDRASELFLRLWTWLWR